MHPEEQPDASMTSRTPSRIMPGYARHESTEALAGVLLSKTVVRVRRPVGSRDFADDRMVELPHLLKIIYSHDPRVVAEEQSPAGLPLHSRDVETDHHAARDQTCKRCNFDAHLISTSNRMC